MQRRSPLPLQHPNCFRSANAARKCARQSVGRWAAAAQVVQQPREPPARSAQPTTCLVRFPSAQHSRAEVGEHEGQRAFGTCAGGRFQCCYCSGSRSLLLSHVGMSLKIKPSTMVAGVLVSRRGDRLFRTPKTSDRRGNLCRPLLHKGKWLTLPACWPCQGSGALEQPCVHAAIQRHVSRVLQC